MSANTRAGKKRPDTTDGVFDSDGAERECRNCGRTIDPTIARVVGDNDNCVQRCKDCAEGYSRTVVAAQAARGDGLRVAAKGRRGGGDR